MKTFKNLGKRIDGILNDINSSSEELLIASSLASSCDDEFKKRLLEETFMRLKNGKIITPDIVDKVIASDELVVNDITSDAARMYILNYVFESAVNNETKITVEEAKKIYPLLNGAIKTDEAGDIGIMYIPIAMYYNEKENQNIVIFASAIGDFNIVQNEEAAVFVVGITYSDYNDDNRYAVWQEVRP